MYAPFLSSALSKGEKNPQTTTKNKPGKTQAKLKSLLAPMKTKLLQPHTSSSTQACHFGTPPSEPALNTRRGG